MKNWLLVCLALSFAGLSVKAQDEETEQRRGFKPENLFAGGSITISFFNNQTLLGANPIFGYKLTDWADAGLAFNFLYTAARDYAQYNDRIRQYVYGPGAFVRLYPFKFLFLHSQFEHNFTRQKYIYPGGALTDEYKVDASSLLLGGGIAQGREKGSTTFYYIEILFDVLKNVNSPYVSVSYNPSNPAQQRVDVIPIFRAGINVGLFQGRYNRGE